LRFNKRQVYAYGHRMLAITSSYSKPFFKLPQAYCGIKIATLYRCHCLMDLRTSSLT